MPEGPEIRRAADRVANAVEGQVTTAVFFGLPQLKKYESVLCGERVTAVTSRGKAMLTTFSNGYVIYSHNQLYGVWMTAPAGAYPETNRQLRLAIETETDAALLYSASEIEVLREPELEAHPFLTRLGPDVLDKSVTVAQVAARYVDDRFRRKRLTTLLLDQTFLAGLGNYLRSEILFVARVHPDLRPMDCSEAQIGALAEASLMLPRQSYQTAGVTNDLALAEKLKAEGVPFKEYRFWVFRRGGKACYVCGTAVTETRVGGRRLDYCPNCQRKDEG